jgi:hypothetical protein
MHHFLSLCPVSGCTATFESNTELESHIAANLHNIEENERRTTNDTARLHLTEILRTTNINTQTQTQTILQSQDVSNIDLTKSDYYERFSSAGWALRTRKHTNPVSAKVENFIENLWLNSQETQSKLTPEQIQQQIRTNRDANGDKLFQLPECPTLGQIKYRCRKMKKKHGINTQQELINELTQMNTQ